MRFLSKPVLIGAALALCAWGVNGLRDAPAAPTLASAAPAASTAASPSWVRWLDRVADDGATVAHSAAPPMVPTEQPVAPAAPRVGTATAVTPREATNSGPATAAPSLAAASVSLPPGVTMEDVAISPTGIVAVLRRAPASTSHPDDGPGYGATAVQGRPVVARSQ